jgi:hypothetical protein
MFSLITSDGYESWQGYLAHDCYHLPVLRLRLAQLLPARRLYSLHWLWLLV